MYSNSQIIQIEPIKIKTNHFYYVVHTILAER